ncbi:virulence RhuM family protein [Serpentinimonas barnesii]|uniref:virulence RhuM family protein n=1 Tax=Serpentinimonas barnesii TaxID=1458427 RepID=UPI0004984CD6|nr:virulence RhuM family protein [Serpentinimonas barnesii]
MTDGNASQFVIYQSDDGKIKLDVRFVEETVWLTQQQLAELFQTSRTNVVEHIQHIYKEGELDAATTCRDFRQVRTEGTREVARNMTFYNLDMTLSVGYRVKSAVATRFRIWATQQLREYIVKGFLLNDERLKNPDQPFDYFEELTRRIQDIRTSERRFYQKITDIYATSVDYDPTQAESISFFQTVQNKMHWAITGQTAAEIIHTRADKNQPNMGLTNWRGGKVRKTDVSIAKNYLSADELAALNNLVEQYLVFAEGQAMRRVPMTMNDWISKLHGFLTINDRDILNHAGKISHEVAKAFAESEYVNFNKAQIAKADQLESDFDQAMKRLPQPKPAKQKT